MQPKLSKSTELFYRSLVNLLAAGYKPKFISLSTTMDLWPVFWDGSLPKREVVFYFQFDLFDSGPIAYFEIIIEDLDVDWKYLQETLQYEIISPIEWDRILKEGRENV